MVHREGLMADWEITSMKPFQHVVRAFKYARRADRLGMMSLEVSLERLPTQSFMACIREACTVDGDWSMMEPKKSSIVT